MSRRKGKNTLPLRSVSLDEHGIGHFERTGKFKGPGEIEVTCQADQIDAMLKSFLVLSEDGRKISAVTYESSKSTESRLLEFGFDLRDCKGMAELILQIKGAPVTIETTAGESVSGRVLGLNDGKQIVEENAVQEQQIVIFTDEKFVRWITLSAIKQLSINDPSLADEIQQQLELLLQRIRKKDRKALKIRINDEDESTLTISYTIPWPSWKTSYRLRIKDEGTLSLQGSGLIDNTQEEAWTDVRLVLVCDECAPAASIDNGEAREALGSYPFRYEIPAPITVPRNSSALVTFIDSDIGGERLAIYDGSRNHEFPSAVLLLKNNTGRTIPAGPVTILEGTTAVGESVLEVLKPGDSRSLSYGSDFGVRVVVQREQKCTPISKVRAWHGHLYFDYKEQITKTYNLENLTHHRQVVWLDHPIIDSQNYMGSHVPSETTSTSYRFRIELEPMESKSLVVPEEQESAKDVWLDNFDSVEAAELIWAVEQRFSDVNFSTFLEQVAKRRRVILTMQQMERSMREQVMHLNYDFEKAREIVRNTGLPPDERKRNALEDLEARMARANAELFNMVAEIADRRRSLASFTALELSAEVIETAGVSTEDAILST
jgi:hypothetical protein